MADEENKLEHGEIDPAKEFFLVAVASPGDGALKVDWDGNVGFPNQAAATDWAKDSAYDGSEFMLYRCTPIKRVLRGPVRVAPYTPKKS